MILQDNKKIRKIKISERIKTKLPDLKLGVIMADVIYENYNENLWQEINKEIKRIEALSSAEIKEIPQISSTRQAYKILGKEPSRYRPSSEALMRRIMQGKGLYKISNLVDTINYISISTGYSIGGYDADKIDGDISLDIGDNKEYKAIGRGVLNVEFLPVFYDNQGAFGSPTSDSERTMITEKTTNVLWIVMNFGNHQNFEEDLQKCVESLKKYCYSKNVEFQIK